MICTPKVRHIWRCIFYMAKKGQVFKKCSAEFIKKISLPKTNGFAWRKIKKQEIQNIFNTNKGRYGYRRITIAMCNKGYIINLKTVKLKGMSPVQYRTHSQSIFY